MSELEKRLAALLEAQTPARVPPFVEVRHLARTRSRGRAVAATVAGTVVLVLVVVVASFVVVQSRAGQGDRSPVAGPPGSSPPPGQITENGVALRFVGDVVVDRVQVGRVDRSTLVVEAGHEAPQQDWYCVPFTVVRVLAEDAGTVRIAAYAYEPVNPPPPDLGCTLQGRPSKRHVLTLGAPLDGRTVLDRSRTLTVRDPATVLTPAALPPGYAMPGEVSWELPAPNPGQALYVDQIFYRGSTEFLNVGQADPVAEQILSTLGGQPSVFTEAAEFTVEGRPSVRGHAGVVFGYGPRLRCVRWRESPALAVVVCSHRDDGPLPSADLLGVAEGLRVGG